MDSRCESSTVRVLQQRRAATQANKAIATHNFYASDGLLAETSKVFGVTSAGFRGNVANVGGGDFAIVGEIRPFTEQFDFTRNTLNPALEMFRLGGRILAGPGVPFNIDFVGSGRLISGVYSIEEFDFGLFSNRYYLRETISPSNAILDELLARTLIQSSSGDVYPDAILRDVAAGRAGAPSPGMTGTSGHPQKDADLGPVQSGTSFFGGYGYQGRSSDPPSGRGRTSFSGEGSNSGGYGSGSSTYGGGGRDAGSSGSSGMTGTSGHPQKDRDMDPSPGRGDYRSRPDSYDHGAQGGWASGIPILLDLNGNGIEITELTRSTRFMDANGDGLRNRTAWAGVGDAVLFYDPDGRNAITEARQYIFSEWDPTAGSDIEALRAVFDTNGDGRLTAADANFAKFKLMVTNADGSTLGIMLSELGSAELDHTAETSRLKSMGDYYSQGRRAARNFTARSNELRFLPSRSRLMGAGTILSRTMRQQSLR